MFDLPFNPDLLEQRIGRLDRIGQAHDIQIHVPYLEKTAQSVLVRWYHDCLFYPSPGPRPGRQLVRRLLPETTNEQAQRRLLPVQHVPCADRRLERTS
ncbi:hypothetical protein, partial [Stenotrophomonas sp. MB339]|uniref:hypothetical protein n=1 Tax=Stenotrophomonas sp. MB339 TaxID=1663558 RepID=UPI0031B628D8